MALAQLGPLGELAQPSVGAEPPAAFARRAPLQQSCPPLAAGLSDRCRTPLNLGPGAWCWFADQRAVHIHRDGINEIVAGWASPSGDVVVESIASDGSVKKKILGRLYEDDHIAPAISVERDNRVTVYWSGHDGRDMFFRTTEQPGNLDRWWPRQQLTSNTSGILGYTYPNPIILAAEANRHYLFWRGGNWEPAYSLRENRGGWTHARELLNVTGKRPYVKVATNGSDRIGFAFTDGHPDNDMTSIYFIEYRRGHLFTARGQGLGALGGRTVEPSLKEVVYDARANRGARSWVQDTAFDPAEHPVIVYALFPARSRAQYWYARWNGRRWQRHFMVAAGPPIQISEPHYLGGMVLDHARPNVVYLSRKIGDTYQVERWQTADTGRSWHHIQVTHGQADNVRPVLAQELPRSPPGRLSLLTLRGEYNDYLHFGTSISLLLGAFGVSRLGPLTTPDSAGVAPGAGAPPRKAGPPRRSLTLRPPD